MICAVAVFIRAQPILALDQVTITEPNHVIGYLPLYVAQRRGFFAEQGIEATWTTIETGSGPTNAILTGQAFAMLGGPEHNAYARIKGADLRAIAGVLMRSSVYVMAAKGQEPVSRPGSAAVSTAGQSARGLTGPLRIPSHASCSRSSGCVRMPMFSSSRCQALRSLRR